MTQFNMVVLLHTLNSHGLHSVPVGYSLLQLHSVCIYDEIHMNGIKLTFTLGEKQNGIVSLS